MEGDYHRLKSLRQIMQVQCDPDLNKPTVKDTYKIRTQINTDWMIDDTTGIIINFFQWILTLQLCF